MRFVAYVIMLFSFSVILYYMGYGPIITIFEEKGAAPLSISCPAGNPFCTDTTVVIGAMIFIILSAGILVTLVSGFSSFYIVPLLLLIAVLNFVIFPFNFIVSSIYKYDRGMFDLAGGSKLFVNRGAGTWGPPMRFGSQNEITLLELG